MRVNAGLNIRVDVQLEVGGLSEVVQVQAATTLIDTGVIGRTVRRRTDRRDAAQLAPRHPGGAARARHRRRQSRRAAGAGQTFATGITSINGGRSEEFLTTVDGAPSIRVRANGGFTMGMQNADTVEEVQVLTTNYQAEHGRASAGLLRLVTKSGGQRFRGNGFWTAAGRLAQRQHLDEQPGRHREVAVQLQSVRLHARRPHLHPRRVQLRQVQAVLLLGRGMGSHPLGGEPACDRAVGRHAERRLQRAAEPGEPYYRAVRLIRDPLTGLPCTAADQRGCFQGNVIPRDRISPNGLALLNSYPLPTPGFQQGTNNWIGTPATFDDTRKDSIKIDFVPANNTRIAVRSTWAPHVWNDPESATAFSSIWDYPGRTVAATYTGTLSTRSSTRHLLVGLDEAVAILRPAELRLLSRRYRARAVSDALVDIGLNYPFLFPDTKLDPDKLSNLAIQSFSTLTLNQYPGYWYDFVFLWSDSVTKITGNHTFKGGVSVERSGMKDQIQLSAASAPATTNQNGSFRFTDATRTDGTGLAMSNALLGLFDDYTEFGTKPLTNFIGMGYDFYAQDSWKPTRKLTLELGLRYSLWQQWRDENNAIASFQSSSTIPRPPSRSIAPPASSCPAPAIRSMASSCPATAPARRRCSSSRSWPTCSRLYRGMPPGFAPDPKDGLQPRLGMAYALERDVDDPQRHRPLPEPAADQHERRLRVQPAAVGDGHGDQRQRRRAGWRRSGARSRW